MLELNMNPNENNPCPICRNLGQKVKKVTVEYQMKDNIAPHGEQFFLCRTPEISLQPYALNIQKQEISNLLPK